MSTSSVPKSLRFWFVVHFVADIAFAIPLFLFPQWFLELFHWHSIDPFAARLVAAAGSARTAFTG